MNRPVRVYYLYPTSSGRFTNQSVAYTGVEYRIAAVSIKQAYYYAGRNVWADYSAPSVQGILSVYSRNGFRSDGTGGWTRLPCGHSVHGGPKFPHGASATAIRAAIRANPCPDCSSSTLGDIA